jgi:hypothetical protein
MFEKEFINLRPTQHTDRFICFGANSRDDSLEEAEGRKFIDIAKRGPLVSRIDSAIRHGARDNEP